MKKEQTRNKNVDIYVLGRYVIRQWKIVLFFLLLTFLTAAIFEGVRRKSGDKIQMTEEMQRYMKADACGDAINRELDELFDDIVVNDGGTDKKEEIKRYNEYKTFSDNVTVQKNKLFSEFSEEEKEYITRYKLQKTGNSDHTIGMKRIYVFALKCSLLVFSIVFLLLVEKFLLSDTVKAEDDIREVFNGRIVNVKRRILGNRKKVQIDETGRICLHEFEEDNENTAVFMLSNEFVMDNQQFIFLDDYGKLSKYDKLLIAVEAGITKENDFKVAMEYIAQKAGMVLFLQ